MLRPYSGLVSLNGNLLCAIDVETTGLDPTLHDIIEICVLPLDVHFKPQKLHECRLFNMSMRPRRPENIDWAALTVNKSRYVDILNNSLDSDRVMDLFVEWFERLNLGTNKRISPLAHNWIFDSAMIKDWIGVKTYDMIFDARYRDTMAFALAQNDSAEYRGDRCPYAKVKLSHIAAQFQIDTTDAHSALPDCRITAEVYAEMIKRHW